MAYNPGPQGFDERTLATARAGDPAAMVVMGVFYADGPTSARDPASARDWFTRGATAGSALAMFDLGLANENGLGANSDLESARRWYQQASDKGDTDATLNLIAMLLNQSPNPSTDARAIVMARQLAAIGNVGGIADMAFAARNGRGLPRDAAEAARWYQQGADKGDAEAMYRLASAYDDGNGVAVDKAKALSIFQKTEIPGMKLAEAVLQMDASFVQPDPSTPIGRLVLGLYYLKNGQHDQAANVFRQGADEGQTYAMWKLATMYASGDGVPQDNNEAIRLFRAAGLSSFPDKPRREAYYKTR